MFRRRLCLPGAGPDAREGHPVSASPRAGHLDADGAGYLAHIDRWVEAVAAARP